MSSSEANLPDQFSALMRETRLSSSLTVLFSQAVAERLGVHSTDIETLDLLGIYGPMTAGQLAEHAGLTTGATTRLIDRLERAGFVRRHHDENDRRRVIIEPNWERATVVMALFESVGRRMGELWKSYSSEDLATIIDFMQRSNRIMAEENAALRGRPHDPDPPR